MCGIWQNVFLSWMVLCVHASDRPRTHDTITTRDVKTEINKQATLTCVFKTGSHSRGWFMMTWLRLAGDGSRESIVQLKARNKIPEYSDVSEDLRSRLTPLVTIHSGRVEFSIRIANITCTDRGEYSCAAIRDGGEMVSTAALSIVAPLEKPIITTMPVTRPLTRRPGARALTMECVAHVGRGSDHELMWYSRDVDEEYFRVMEFQDKVIKFIDRHGCTTAMSRKVSIELHPGGGNSRYRCAYYGFMEADGLYAEVVLGYTLAQDDDIRFEAKTGRVNRSESSKNNSQRRTVPPVYTMASIIAYIIVAYNSFS